MKKTSNGNNGDNLKEGTPLGERHQLHTLNPSQLSGSGGVSDPSQKIPMYDTQIPSRTNDTTTQALVNDPTSPTQQPLSPLNTNVIQPNSPSEKDPTKFQKPRVGGIASLADPSVTSPGSTIIPMIPSSPMVVNDSANETSDAQQQVKISNL